ncbi:MULTISPECIES: magnesium chelatase subunit H [Methylobacterium]|jgi:magnesium chelatase subunit H|uniref:magnesium chelatase subunit H n=3 Tax=Methylobacteriaceae TaxID=119045 RepID=UPI0008F37428|nr:MULTISPECIES: magnesium chelatase subunit H [Methylobacterium]MBK3399622.1 magnesium chelatase subunit H [Methylobacterium ajmalii]MBK3408224.1 magnesium chelatase subunit H [Methylobacterium ajmalii]MBZ6414247.1 magnesium chelatase subunit H [Methylobacterium sp.]SFE46791.1 cobaltochelatase CobN subunit [Methylobacterium sp. yr596]
MPKRISAGDGPGALPELRVVIVTLDNHLAGAVERARRVLAVSAPGLVLGFHAAAEWETDPSAVEACRADIARADIVLSAMLFMDEHVRAVLPALLARRTECDAMVGCLSAAEVVRTTRMNRFAMDGSQRGALDFLKRLRGKSGPGGTQGNGARQMALIRQIPRILRFIPGSAQDVRAYFLTLQYWLAGSDENVVNLVRFLAGRYAAGPRTAWRRHLTAAEPLSYPETGLYHPRLAERVTERLDRLPASGKAGRVGLLLMRSYVLAGNTAHYDGAIAALEARGLSVVPAFASGLDNRPAVEKFFLRDGRSAIDALVSLTGFSLVGGPAYNDAAAASAMLARLDVPYLAAQAVEFQTLEQWEASARGLSPVEATMMVAIPELDGATAPMVFGGRSAGGSESRDMAVHPERTARLAERVARLVSLRARARAERKVAIVLFNFPPNAGATGTAAFLSVWDSLHRVLQGLNADGYSVEVPESVDALRARVLEGNAARFGTQANVAHRITADDHVRREAHLAEIEAQWGPAPGRHQSDGSTILVLGAHFGNVFVGVQPAFGYEGDPMRLLFEHGFAPTHAFSAFYRYLREDFCADAVLHFGTHGALEFMPGKQTGLSAACWPERLIGALPHVYLYAANNPSEGTLAKRRAAATLVSYLTPSLAQAGLYRGLIDLKASLERRRALPPEEAAERGKLAALIHGQALALDLAAGDGWGEDAEARIADLAVRLIELEHTLIPHGLHVVGQGTPPEERIDLLLALAESVHGLAPDRAGIARLVAGATPEEAAGPGAADATLAAFRALAETDRLLAEDHEIPALLRALDGRFVAPVAGGDVLRSPAILPTGRNLHGFDPYRIPSAFALADGRAQVEKLLARHAADGGAYPESIALVLWGSDNLKSEGAPVAQALALMGAQPRFDGYGRLCGAVLIPIEDLGRPRIDVVATLSGIFRDLLPLQTKLLAEAAWLAASADEPQDMNFVRKHALAHQAAQGIDLETAALRVFSNAEGAYGANLNHLVDSGRWEDETELCETFSRRKSFAYGRDGRPEPRRALMQAVLAGVDLAYQNLDSVEVGVTSVDHYFDGLGGMARAVAKARGTSVPVYISDQTRGEGRVRSLSEQVALETRTRMLNPKWVEGMLGHGYEGVRQIDQHLTNTVGWSATTDQVAPWIYQRITETYVLDEAMRERMAALNPAASAKVAHRLIEAHRRGFWTPDPETRAALDRAEEALEDRLEGITAEAAA